MRSSTLVDPERGSSTASLLRVLLFAVLAVLIVSFGSGVLRDRAPRTAAPDQTEQARTDALHRTQALQAGAESLASTDPKLREALATLTQALRIQADDLTIPAPSAAAATTSPAAGVSTPAAPSAAPPSAAELVTALSESGKAALREAENVDGGMARLLAGTGAGQLLNARALAKQAGVPAPTLPADDPSPQPTSATASATAAGTAAAPSSTGCATPGTAPGVNAGSALFAVAEAEQKAVYGYQVAATRFSEPSFSTAVTLLGQHRSALGQALAQLSVRCLSLPSNEPGYALGTAFTEQPAAALGRTEEQLGHVYGDLVALSDGELRRWAINRLVDTVGRGYSWTARVPSVPGIATQPGN